MIDHLTKADIDRLLERSQTLSISIYLPMDRAGAETQKNSAELKAALDRVRAQLPEALRRPETEALFGPVNTLIDDFDFWQHQEDGLALFLDVDGLVTFRLPIPFERLETVGDRFHVKPLLPFLATDGEFYVLGLSHNQIRLLRGSRWRVSEIELTEVPKSLADAIWYKEPEAALQSHATASGGALTFHGHGLGEESGDEDLREFFRQVDTGIRSIVDPQAPVVLAGVEYLLPLYRSISSLSVTDKGIPGNPERVSPEELHARAWEIVGESFEARRRRAEEKMGASDTSTSMDDVVQAAFQGRVETLFVPRDRQRSGRVDPESLRVEVNDDGADLYDLAAAETWRHRGEVYVVDSEQMPDGAELAAVLRY